MNYIDYTLLGLYGISLIALALFVSKKNSSEEEYFLGSKTIKPSHIGLSVAATDVGGGFSIGLGALGFSMGLSGAWLLFTGLIGALLSSVFLIPKLKRLEKHKQLYSFPQVFSHFYGVKAAQIAAIISFIGYLAFTSSQLIAGTKLAHTLIPNVNFSHLLLILATVTILYTSIGGLKAVVYTDTIQWIIVIIGLAFITIPFSIYKIGGIENVIKLIPSEQLSLTNIPIKTFINWMIGIIPIWFVAMTLYQRIFACKTERDAKIAWYTAGLFEWPIMAFTGVFIGLLAKVLFSQGLLETATTNANFDSELAIPLLIKTVLPSGILGLVFAAYLSAVLSTADSCLMAASGNFYSDFVQHISKQNIKNKILSLFGPKTSTLFLGVIAVIIAIQFESVLALMLYAYGFMISGLFIPTISALFSNKTYSVAAIISMIVGCSSFIIFSNIDTNGWDANIFGVALSAIAYYTCHQIVRKN